MTECSTASREELALRLVIARAFSSDSDIVAQYEEAAAAIAEATAADSVIIIFPGLGGSHLQAGSGEKGPSLLDDNELAGVKAACENGEEALIFRGKSFRSAIFAGLQVPGCTEGSFAIAGNGSREFTEPERLLFRAAADELTGLLDAQVRRLKDLAETASATRELRRSEERLRAFFEDSPEMIYISNLEDRMASINAAGLLLLGAKDRFDLIGRKLSEFAVSPEDRERLFSKVGHDGFIADYEIMMKRLDGSVIYCIESSQAVKDREGHVIEVLGIVKDITERITREKELWQSTLELAEANEKLREAQVAIVQQEKLASIGQLAAGIAHEINNPLGFLKSNHEMFVKYAAKLRKAWDEERGLSPGTAAEVSEKWNTARIFSDIEDMTSESNDGYQRIIGIVQSLKNFARSGQSEAFGSYNLNEGIQSTLIVTRNEYKYSADIELQLGEVPPFPALGGSINQVILNLVVNAAQAISGQKREERGKIRITTGTERGNAVLEVHDNGPGVPEDLQHKVFDPFFTTKEQGKGTGLGLSISYDIVVNKHHGHLTVGKSGLGGALFRMELPMDPAGLGSGPSGIQG
jgi:PAS domain S-box-containing protein